LELFRPIEEDALCYPEYIKGLRKMASAYAARSPRTQARANAYVQRMIVVAESVLGNDMSAFADLAALRDDRPTMPVVAREPEEGAGLFRSASTGVAEVAGATSFFVPDERTLYLLKSCFQEFFVREDGEESLLKSEASPEMKRTYGQLWELFGSGEGRVRRSDFIAGMCTAAENIMGGDPV